MAASMNRSVNEPSKAELAVMTSVMDVMSWASLDGDAGIGLLAAIGASIDAQIHEVAGIDPVDFSEALGEWRVGEPTVLSPNPRRPTAMEKGRARAFHKACRIAAELEW